MTDEKVLERALWFLDQFIEARHPSLDVDDGLYAFIMNAETYGRLLEFLDHSVRTE